MSHEGFTYEKQLAAQLIAEASLTFQQIAKQANVTYGTIYAWRKEPDFNDLVLQLKGDIRGQICNIGICVKENRLRALDARWRLLQRVIEERAESEIMQTAPGGKTGLMVHTVKGLGSGPTFERVDLFTVDTGLLAELRDHEKQAAIEMGQWEEVKVEKTESSNSTADVDAAILKTLKRIAEKDESEGVK